MKMLSVSEYAKKVGKDPGNIRRMLASGRIEGIRIGNQWAIEESVPYPQDRRIRNGDYTKWRNRIGLVGKPGVGRTINDMIRDLRAVYGCTLTRVVLYGSFARREQTEDSDVDIALILDRGHTKSMRDIMIEIVAACEVRCGLTLSVVEIDEVSFDEWKETLPYYRNIDREGIDLWTNI